MFSENWYLIWIRETEAGLPLSSSSIFMEKENKARFNLLLNELMVKREKMKNLFNILSSDF